MSYLFLLSKKKIWHFSISLKYHRRRHFSISWTEKRETWQFSQNNWIFSLFIKFSISVVRNTRNPVYEEDFTFYGLSIAELQSMSLHFVVLSFDRYSRDDVIGEVVCPFTAIDLSQIQNQQVAMSREIQPRSLKVRFGLNRYQIDHHWKLSFFRFH